MAAIAQQQQQQLAVPQSYSMQQFVGFYDTMVAECYAGTAAADVQGYAALLDWHLQQRPEQQTVVVVDLACGTGRATLAILERLTKASLTDRKLQLHIYCIDNSQPMLAAAESQCSAFLRQHPCACLNVRITYLLASFQDWSLPRDEAAADFILVAAAGLHHVTDTQQLRASVQRMSDNLRDGSSLCAISYLPWSQLCRAPDAAASGQSAEEFRVSGYKRVLLSRHVETIPATGHGTLSDAGGSDAKVVHERFALIKLADGGDSGVVDGCGINDQQELWRVEEGWQLRQIEREHLLQWAAEAGLVPVLDSSTAQPSQAVAEHAGSHFVMFTKPAVSRLPMKLHEGPVARREQQD